MLSSNEIRSIEFEKCLRGYRPEQVQETLDKVAAQLEQMQKEKDEMEKKLYILAGKVEEYRNDEDMLKTAMINAQRMGESVIKEARQKAENIIREADLKASLINEKAKEKLNSEEELFVSLQEKVAEFKAEVLSIYKNHIESLSDLPVDENLFPQGEKYAEIDETDFSGVITSAAENSAEPVILLFNDEEPELQPEQEIKEQSFEEALPENEFFSVDIEQTNKNDDFVYDDLKENEVIDNSLGLNGIDYERISLDEEDVKIFDTSSFAEIEEMAQNEDDIIEMPPLKKSVFDIFGDNK